MTSWTRGLPVLVGEQILWLGSGSGLPKSGVVRWIGHLPEISHDWTVGIELDEALPYGGIDGTWGNRMLFTCQPKHGLLVPVSGIIPASQLKFLQLSKGFTQNQDERPISEQKSMVVHSPSKTSSKQPTNQPQPAVRKNTKYLEKTEQCPKSRNFQSPSTLYEESEYSSDENNSETLRIEDKSKAKVILRVKKREIRNVSEINNDQVRRMTSGINGTSFEEAVIDSLYASRHHFASRVETRSESTHAFVSISNSRKEKGASGIFSFFRWFRKEKDDFDDEIENARIPSAPSSPRLIRAYGSTCGSVDTLFSTATASSFAFVHPELYRPFGNANQPDKFIASGPETETYRKRLWQRDKIRELDQNISLKKKYHLFGSGTIHRSADDVYLGHKINTLEKDINDSPGSKNSTFGRRKKRKAPPPPIVEPKPADYSLPNTLEHISKTKDKETSKEHSHYNSRERPRHRRTVSDSSKDRKAGAYCHVRGKRKAPPPPTVLSQTEINNITASGCSNSGRKKRPAPPPPIEFLPTEDKTISRGSLSPEEKLRLLDSIEKLKLHAEKKSTTEINPEPNMSYVVSNDSLKLEKGVLKANKAEMQVSEVKQNPASPVSPRPWYKRNIIHKENGKSLEKKKEKIKGNDWMPEVGVPRGSIINTENNRFSNIFSKSDEKRNSQISMLVNISELDREAAEIVKREQEKEKEKLAALNSKFYTDNVEPEQMQNIVSENETVETPKKSSARELISLFNAIGNVTKVTVNSKFFSKNGASIFSKEGIEKRFSFVNEPHEEKVVVQETVVTESVSRNNGYKRETTVIGSQQTYLESPGVKRRRNLIKQDSNAEENLPSSSSSSDSVSPRVTIEEIDEFDAEKASRTQAMYEANRLRRHHSPSPTIPTIVEMSEATSSVATSPGSTISKNSAARKSTGSDIINLERNKNEPITNSFNIKVENKVTNSSISNKDINLNVSRSRDSKESNKTDVNITNNDNNMASSINKDIISSNIASDSVTKETSQQTKMVTIWSCPRCTLENPRWRITCEACDMWRPSVDNIVDNVTANFANGVDKKTPANLKPDNLSELKKEKKGNNLIVSESRPIVNTNNLNKTSKDITTKTQNNLVSKITSNKVEEKDEIKYPPITNTNLSEIINSKSSSKLGGLHAEKSNISLPSGFSNNKQINGSKAKTENNIQSDADMDEVRKARLAFFHKGEKENNFVQENVIEVQTNKKNTIATNEEERLKIKEMLKEMKNSLPKRSKNSDDKSDRRTESTYINCTARPEIGFEKDSTKLGAIKKNIPQKTSIEKHKGETNVIIKNSLSPGKAEIFLVKNEVIIEDIKIKKVGEKPEKVSTSAQTNGMVRKVESVPIGNSSAKPPAGRITPKASRKEFIVPITVEEYTIKDGVLYTSLSKERRRIGTGTFELIRPRDFASIEATKTGNDNIPVHVYANVPTNNEPIPQVVSTSAISTGIDNGNTSIDTNDVDKLTAELTRPKGLAEFKAGLEGSGPTHVDSNMNTLAVNRILRRLEAAIAGGQHQLAASLAKELARLKINCSVTRHKQTSSPKFITVDMFVEDKVSHQGPIPLQINPTMTVAQLKAKVDREFEIPAQVQRWILGKQLAVDDSMTLEQLDVSVPHSPIFLYLVAPGEGSLDKDKSSNLDKAAKPDLPALVEVERKEDSSNAERPVGRGWYYNDEEDKFSLCESESNESSKAPSPEPNKEVKVEIKKQNSESEVEEVVEEEDVEYEVEEVEEEEEEEEEEGEEEEVKVEVKKPTVFPVTGTLALGWKCPLCTLVNSPTRPGCLACTTMRPVEYNIPVEYQVSKTELERMRLEVRTEKAEEEEKLKHYQQLVNLENADLVVSAEPFDCSVCLVNYPGAEGVVLRDCLHTFCRVCLAHTVEFSEEAEVKCPFRDENYACDSTLQAREIKALVTAEAYEQHLAKSVAQAENKIGNAFHCKTPDCRGWCIFEDNVNQFICPVCSQNNCLTCQAIHKGLNCKQFQEQVHEDSETNADARRTREMLEEMVDRGEAMNCPTCQVILMKKWGCDWLRCSMCKTEICWVTRGPRWGPLGKGDTSGGCQCGVNGVKCHPKCNYCH